MRSKELTVATDIIREHLKKFPKIGSLTLAKKLVNDFPEIFLNAEKARDSIRVIRGQHGKASVKDKTFHISSKETNLPKSQEENWTKFYLKDLDNLGILSDIHTPYQNNNSLKVALNYLKETEIDSLLINGDFLDFYTLSRFFKRPGKFLPKQELAMAAKIMLKINDMFSDQKKFFKLGNHDERWDHYFWSAAPLLYDLEHLSLESALAIELSKLYFGVKNKSSWKISLKDFGWEIISDKRPVIFNGLSIFHGHELPKGIANPVNSARGAFLKTHITMLCGHHHQTSVHTEYNAYKDEIVCWSTGCLCGLYPEWARVNKWNHGFARVTSKNRGFDVYNYRISKHGNVRAS